MFLFPGNEVSWIYVGSLLEMGILVQARKDKYYGGWICCRSRGVTEP